ncbi:MAG: tetratricopeptide repeat protein [Bacteroidales bacterium]|nr:tetratricopeptide repeat protein [Bacteroidales bacterium]
MKTRQQPTAVSLIGSGQYKQAKDILTDITRKDPGNIDALFLIGVCQKSRGKLKKAESVFRDVIKSVPNHPLALYNLGLILESKEQFEDAVVYWKKAIKILPHFEDAAKKLSQYTSSPSPTLSRTRPSKGRPSSSFSKPRGIYPGLGIKPRKSLKPEQKKAAWVKNVINGIEIRNDVGLYYTENHIWVSAIGNIATIGITDFFRFTLWLRNLGIQELLPKRSSIISGQVLGKIRLTINKTEKKRLYPKYKKHALENDSLYKMLGADTKEKKYLGYANCVPTSYKKLGYESILFSLVSPISGKIIKVNDLLLKRINGINEPILTKLPWWDIYNESKSWICMIRYKKRDRADSDLLMDDKEYSKYVGSILIGHAKAPKYEYI